MRRAFQIIQALLGLLLFSSGTLLLLWGFFSCWLFRDGLGPGAVPSHGWEAASRFASGFWQVLVISMTLCGVGGYLLRRCDRHLIK